MSGLWASRKDVVGEDAELSVPNGAHHEDACGDVFPLDQHKIFTAPLRSIHLTKYGAAGLRAAL